MVCECSVVFFRWLSSSFLLLPSRNMKTVKKLFSVIRRLQGYMVCFTKHAKNTCKRRKESEYVFVSSDAKEFLVLHHKVHHKGRNTRREEFFFVFLDRDESVYSFLIQQAGIRSIPHLLKWSGCATLMYVPFIPTSGISFLSFLTVWQVRVHREIDTSGRVHKMPFPSLSSFLLNWMNPKKTAEIDHSRGTQKAKRQNLQGNIGTRTHCKKESGSGNLVAKRGIYKDTSFSYSQSNVWIPLDEFQGLMRWERWEQAR